MSLKLRFGLVLGLLFLGFGAALFVLRGLERGAASQAQLDERKNRELILNHWLDLSTRTLPEFVADYVQLESIARLAHEKAPADLEKKISADLRKAGLADLWVFGGDGTARMHVTATGQGEPTERPIAAGDFKALVAHSPSPRFFSEPDGRLREVCTQRIPDKGADVAMENQAWLLVTRIWDQAQLDLLASLTNSSVSLVAPSATLTAPATLGEIVLLRPLRDWEDHTVRLLRVESRTPEFDQMIASDVRRSGVFVAFGLLVLVAMWLALQAWVLRPLDLVSASLATNDVAPIQPLQREPGELGGVAKLIASSFAQREELRREIAERARTQEALQRSDSTLRRTMDERLRLGRDLHDGVIQSLYAAGMGLTGVRSQLRDDQVEAAARLEQTRAVLNATIHDLRNYINGLEPDSLKLQTFSHAVTAMLEVVKGLRPLETTIAIDEALAIRLTLAQRVHALQIAREAVSNALRHGDAHSVTIALRAAGENIEFEIVDDGRGFDSKTPFEGGHGLRNFAERARELGGELTLSSASGRGTRVHLEFALIKSL